MSSPALGMLFGFINTVAIHVAKSMQRHGINTLRWRSTHKDNRSRKHAAIYIAGVVINNISAIWLILANRFAAPAYATGMFGLGLVLLLLYSSLVLGEPVHWVNYVGAALVVLGTAAFSLHALTGTQTESGVFDPSSVGIFAAAYFVPVIVVLLITLRFGGAHLQGFVFGILTGSLASLDPVLKAIGQTAGGSATLVPSVAWGWLPFLLSFPVGVMAFLVSQYAFYRGANASDTVPAHSSFYVLLPVLVQIVAMPGYTVTPPLLFGIATIVAGIVLMQRRRAPVEVNP